MDVFYLVSDHVCMAIGVGLMKSRSLGAIVVLTLASRTVNLKHLVPDISELQTLVIKNLTPWATVGSSLEAVISIIQDMQRKQRLLDYI